MIPFLNVVDATCNNYTFGVCLNDYQVSVLELLISLAVVFYIGGMRDTLLDAIPNRNQIWIMKPVGKGILKFKKAIRIPDDKKVVDVGRFKNQKRYMIDESYTMFHKGFANQRVIPIIENNTLPPEHSFEGTKPIMEVIMKGDKDNKQTKLDKDGKETTKDEEIKSVRVTFTLPLILMADRLYKFFKDDYVTKSFAGIFEQTKITWGATFAIVILVAAGGGYLMGNNFPYTSHYVPPITVTQTITGTSTLSGSHSISNTTQTFTTTFTSLSTYCYQVRNGVANTTTTCYTIGVPITQTTTVVK